MNLQRIGIVGCGKISGIYLKKKNSRKDTRMQSIFFSSFALPAPLREKSEIRL